MTRLRVLTKLGPALLAAAAFGAAAEEYEPHKTPRAQFRTQVDRIALRPLRLDPGIADATRDRFEPLIRAELEARGYGVVGSSQFRDTWVRFARDLGGVYDAATGSPIEEKHKLAWEHTTRELERTLGVDAVLTPEITVELQRIEPSGPGTGVFVHWTAGGEPLLWQGERLYTERNHPQRVEGPYLVVSIHDRAGVPLFEEAVPIRWSRTYIAGGYEERPASQVYLDDERNRSVVRTAFEKLEPR